jgi:hypothetical protein
MTMYQGWEVIGRGRCVCSRCHYRLMERSRLRSRLRMRLLGLRSPVVERDADYCDWWI